MALIGLLVSLVGGFWIVYSALDGKIENKIEGLRRRAHETGNMMHLKMASIDEDIDDIGNRVARLEGKLNGRVL
jgi:hypothetical protein